VSVHVCALAFSGLKIVPSLELQFATFVVLSVYRALFYTAMIALLIEMYAHNQHTNRPISIPTLTIITIIVVALVG
jgi:hypothetical protein